VVFYYGPYVPRPVSQWVGDRTRYLGPLEQERSFPVTEAAVLEATVALARDVVAMGGNAVLALALEVDLARGRFKLGGTVACAPHDLPDPAAVEGFAWNGEGG